MFCAVCLLQDASGPLAADTEDAELLSNGIDSLPNGVSSVAQPTPDHGTAHDDVAHHLQHADPSLQPDIPQQNGSCQQRKSSEIQQHHATAPQQQQQQQDRVGQLQAPAGPAAVANALQEQQQQQQSLIPVGAYTQREEHLQRQEAAGDLEFAYVLNDGQPINMIRCESTVQHGPLLSKQVQQASCRMSGRAPLDGTRQ